jgi:HAD superfamily hydrolase (TIGR01509 family)
MIKAVIFDFFGVLAGRDDVSFRKTFLAKDPAKNAKARQLNDQLGLGKLSYDDFIDELAHLGEVSREKVLQYTEDYHPNEELLDFIKQSLKPSLKIAIISNAGQDWVLRILGEENLKLFDDIILSYKVGLIKPQPEIYEVSARNLGVQEEECVFIDDILRYCQGAEQVGMNSIWYQGFGQFKQELDQIFSVSSGR